MLILFAGGCKKEISKTGDISPPDVMMATSGDGVITKVLRQSPGLKVEATGDKINRISEKLKYPEKLESVLRELGKKNKKPAITVSNVGSFAATLVGSVYYCSVDFPYFEGDKEFWLVNLNTWVYTYASASSTTYATFTVNKPLLPGRYLVWAEGPSEPIQFSNELTLGDPYIGVSVNSGMLSFTSASAYEALESRLENAYETHQTFLNQYDNLSDDDADVAAVSAGFDEFLPYKEFEAFLGFSSLRAQIQAEVDYWYTQSDNDLIAYPADDYIPYTYEQQTLINTDGEIEVNGVGEGPLTLPTQMNIFIWRDPVNPGQYSCVFKAEKKQNQTYDSIRQIKKKVFITQDIVNDETSFVANIQTLKKQWLFNRYYPSLQRQRVRVYGNHYDETCGSSTAFNSGLTNSGLHKRYSQRTRYKLEVEDYASKSNEFSLEGVIGSGSYVLTYSH